MMNQFLLENTELVLAMALISGVLTGVLGSYMFALRIYRRRALNAEKTTEQLQADLQHQQLQLQQEITHQQSVRADLNVQIKEYKQQLELQQDKYLNLSTQSARQQAELDQARLNLDQQVAMLESAKTELKREFELTANRLFQAKSEQFSNVNQSLLESTLSPFKVQLQDFRKKVEDVYEKENTERSRLSGQIMELQKQAHKISEDAVNLARALKGNSKTQGGWGEVVLERLLEQSGLHKGREYETQLAFQSADGTRRLPDVVVRLPEGKDIIIDAKVSLTDYERYCNADNESDREKHLQLHIQSIRAHIRGLSAKDYENLPGLRVLDFVFIFIPIEAAFMLALQYEPNLYKEAYDKHIILASPTTLLAILRTVENIWRYEKQNKNAEKIAQQAGSLHDQFVRVLEALDGVGGQLNKAQEAYQLVHNRLSSGRGNLLKRVDDIRKLGAKTKRTIDPALLDESEQELLETEQSPQEQK
ncbi:MAG TPA: DNA recombination protein RmuC [Cellvibrionaceae bacterium]